VGWGFDLRVYFARMGLLVSLKTTCVLVKLVQINSALVKKHGLPALEKATFPFPESVGFLKF